MQITAKITGLKYDPKLTSNLTRFDIIDFDINTIPSSCIVNLNGFLFGLSKWVSPKRTRSYPYERVYNTLGTSKRITVIPIIKDEGQDGDRDFIQWDTISLMNLLDVYVIFAYYETAEKNNSYTNKITRQKFCNEDIIKKLFEIKNYHSSALHWNLKEIDESFLDLINKVKSSYNSIGRQLDVGFHNERGIDRFSEQFINGVNLFKESSRQRALEAQSRELHTIQPKESLSTATKAAITIENYLGGKYFFTTDEVAFDCDKVLLIEAKHSRNSLLPSINDIKDGLLKMILYTNLKDVSIEGENYQAVPILKLTSSRITSSNTENINSFLAKNAEVLTPTQKRTMNMLFEESQANDFAVIITKA